MADALGTPGGVVSDEEHRLAMAGLIAPQTSSLAVRTGVLHGPGTTALVTGTAATGTMTVNVAAHHWVSTRGTADGIYLGTVEASTVVNIAAAPGANSRIDVIYVKQQDAGSTVSPDGVTAMIVDKVTGTAAASPTKPAIPVGALELATVTVAAGATSTNGAGVTIANTAVQTAARGADVPVRTTTERDALTKFLGLTVKRLDDGGRQERWNGSRWVSPSDFPILASIAARNTYFTGVLGAGSSALVAGNLHVYDGSAWRWIQSWTFGPVTAAPADAFYSFAHGGGQTPRHWSASVSQQPTEAISLVIGLVEWGADATNLVLRVKRTDSSAWFLGTSFNAKCLAIF